MKTYRKVLVGICGVAALGCVAMASVNISSEEVSAATVTVANEAEYSVYGGAVRVSDATRGPGVKFHVVMTPDKFDAYGTINNDGTGVLDDGVTTGTLLLPYHLTNGNELTVGGTGYGANVADSNTSEVWYKETLGGVEYMQSVVYLYNIPDTDFGTEIAVRGYVSVGGNYTYTEQVNGISMSFVAEAEYNNKASELDATQKESLKDTYLDKIVNYHVNGSVTTEEVYFEDTTIETPTPAATLADGSTFVGWATRSGKIQKNITSTLIKNHKDFYAMYRKSIVLSSANAQSISLTNYDYDSVVSIKYGSYDLGTNPASLTLSDALKADKQNHGEQNITVTLAKDGRNFTVTMPVLFVTKEIATADDFKSIQPSSAVKGVWGYYVLTADITDTTLASKSYVGDWEATTGFFATLDGAGHTISTAANGGSGIFGILRGATIKNVTIKDNWRSAWAGGNCALLAKACFNSTLDNVTFTYVAGNTNATLGNGHGWLCYAEFSGNLVKDVTVNDTQGYGSLFGYKFANNTFENVTINGTYTEMGHTAAGESVAYDEVTKVTVEEATLATRQDFVLDGDWKLLDLGEYNGLEILSVTTSNGETLDTISPFSAKVKMTDLAKHGEQDFYVTVLKEDGAKAIVTVPVTVITKEISTMADLQTAVKHTGKDLYGYYILANNVTYKEEGYTGKNATYAWGSGTGFKGTLDGRNYTITMAGNANQHGVFGTLHGATVKNVHIINMWYNGWGASTLGYTAYNTKFENVQITIYGNTISDTSSSVGAVVGAETGGCTWKNVTINVDKAQGTLFKTIHKDNKTDTFENVVVKIPGLTQFSDQGTPNGVIIGDVVTLTNTYDFVLNGTNAGQLALGEGYEGETISKLEYNGTDITSSIPDSLKTDYSLHGTTQTLTASIVDGITTTKLIIPVTFITQAITTMEELEAAVRYYDEDINGYYVLANDVAYTETGFAWDKAATSAWSTTNGFIGTLDGRNHSITLAMNEDNFTYGLFGTFNGVLKNVTINAMDATNACQPIIARVSCGTVEDVTINVYERVNVEIGKEYKNNGNGALVMGAMYGSAKNVWRNVTVNVDTEINFLFPASPNAATFENCTLNVLGYNGINGTTKDVAGWTVDLGRNTILSDVATQIIDLNITDGNVNSAQTYKLNVRDLTTGNFKAARYNGNPISATGINLNVADFGKTYGEGELEIDYYYGEEVKTHTVPVILVTKVLKTANDVQSFLTWADAYNGATGDNIYDGYYALGNDITFNGTYVPSMVVAKEKRSDKTIGFRGVFDGMGYIIEGMSVINSNYETEIYGTNEVYRSTGFISVLHSEGKIKDVAFTKAKVQFCSYLASFGGGVIENVYVGYEGELANSWNSTVNEQRITGVSPVILHNCIIQYDTAWTQGQILGKVNATANAYQNVYVIGPENTKIIEYWNDSTLAGANYLYPLDNDNFGYYTSMADCLAEHMYDICSWGAFGADEEVLEFNGNILWEGEVIISTFVGNTLISENKEASDYIIIYEDGNAEALNAAAFIAEHIQRATGTITYAVSTTNKGQIMETVTGGIRLTMATSDPYYWTEDSAYIVIGNVDIGDAPKAAAGQYIIQTIGNTVFINADIDEEYITAAIAFLEEAIGYRGLSDDTVYYDKVNDSAVTMPTLDIAYDSAFNVRNSTNAFYTWKNDQLALNGRYHFSIGPINEYGNVAAFHNSIYWLDYETNKSTHAAWFRTTNGVVDVCYAAGGQQNDSNAEYVAMVATAATNMRAILNANPGKTDISFSLMDNDMTGCTCSVCKANRTNAAITFLNDVVTKIQEQDGNADREFRIFILAYYYLIDAPTVDMNEHLGVIYAPVRMNSYEAKSIYDSANDGVREDIVAWTQKTKNIGFWFYGTLYHNYMIFTDTYESMLTWWEFAARTVKNAGGDITWVYQNGQNRQMTATAFEDFKQYVISKAQVEILNKVTVDGSDANYSAQIEAYLLELESEFFGFTVSGSTKTFNDRGYYGPAAANEAMYNMYQQMKTDYAGINGENDGTIYEDIDTVKYSNWIFTAEANRLNDYLDKGKTDGYWGNYTSAMITKYMGYVETAQSAINSYTGSMKTVYSQHILAESLSPRFMMCVAGGSSKSGYGFAGGYNGTAIATLRANLKADFEALDVTYYGEHYKLTDLYDNWGI